MLNLLDLLIIANKYCAATLETLTLAKLLLVTSMQKLATYNIDLTIRVFEVAFLIRSSELARAPRIALREVLRLKRASRDTCLALLSVGKLTGDRLILGAAYYSIMLYGRSWWSTCEAIDVTDQSRLLDGMMRCAYEWHMLYCLWAAKGFGCHSDCERKRKVLERSHQIQLDERVAWYDVLGKLQATATADQLTTVYANHACEVSISEGLLSTTERIKSEVYDYFLNADH